MSRSEVYLTGPETAKRAGLRGADRRIEVRYDDETADPTGEQETVDEVVTRTVHLEGMAEDAVWLDVQGMHVWIRAVRVKGRQRPRLVVTVTPSDVEGPE